jgi:hypothetical protein
MSTLVIFFRFEVGLQHQVQDASAAKVDLVECGQRTSWMLNNERIMFDFLLA